MIWTAIRIERKTRLASMMGDTMENSQDSRIEQTEHGRNHAQFGNNNQLFTAETIDYTEAPARIETPPPPFSTVPFTRDPKFIERKEFVQLQEKLSAGRRVAINGLGGVGKSQLAIEYCHRARLESPSTWVFWLHASNATRFDQEIVSLVEEIKLQGRNAKDVNIYQLLRSWLNDSRKSKRWLIVLDNADDAEYLFAAPQSAATDTRRRLDYIPICSHGSLLVTSRWKKIAERIVDVSDILVLKPERQHATELLKSKLINEHTNGSVEKLAETLEDIALAISQAAAYINARGARCKVDDYIRKLEKSEKSRISILTTTVHELRRDDREAETSNAILLTWRISFEHIRSIRKSAAGMLSLMSFYDNQSIPDYLLRSRNAHYRPGSHVAGDARSQSDSEDDRSSQTSSEEYADETFESDLLLLQEFSLVSQTLDKSVLQMHRLVQLSTQIWLKEQSQYTQWETTSLVLLDLVYPEAEFQHWQRCRFLFPHASRALKSTTQNEEGLISLLSLLDKASQYATHLGEYAQAEIMIKRSLDILGSMRGEEQSFLTLASMNALALTYGDQGRWREAEELHVKVLKAMERARGSKDLHTLTVVQNLASFYANQSRWREAKVLRSKILEVSQRVNGEEHLFTLKSMHDLAKTYARERDRWLETETLQMKALKISRRVYGEEHPFTLKSMRLLAKTYARDRGRRQDAEVLQMKVLEIQKRVFGVEHPETLLSMDLLADMYAGDRGRRQDAEALQVEVLEIQERILGKEHRGTLTSMFGLACIYNRQQKEQQAQDLMTRCAEISGRALGKEHPFTLEIMDSLAQMYYHRGEMQPAQDLMTKCVEARSRVLGAAHPDTKHSTRRLKRFRSAGKKRNAQDGKSREATVNITHDFVSSNANNNVRTRRWTL